MSSALRDSLRELSEEVQVVGLHARALRGSRRVRVRRRIFASVAAILAVTGGTVAVAAIRPSPPPTMEESPFPSTSPSTRLTLPNVDIRNATFEVPAFPYDTECPKAIRTFRNGAVSITRDDLTGQEIRLEMGAEGNARWREPPSRS